jgi:exosortase
MIFVTVGAQMPFDRLIKAVDEWAGKNPAAYIYAQIGETDYVPKHIRWDKFVSPDQLRTLVQSADVVVAHAGMGTILTSLQTGKPVLVMPRRGSLRETRNDHQVATAKQLTSLELVSVAWDEDELKAKLDTCLLDMRAQHSIPPYASGELCDSIAAFIANPNAAIPVDGVICFGGVDWWYHNRGHYDIQMMREFSRVMPVLYVNSIGMRTPTVGEGKVFFKRVARKLRSWSRGLKHVRENFGVLSPVSVPKFHQAAWAKGFLVEQVRDAARQMGIENPLVWVACPPAAEVIDRIPAACLVYQRTDRFEHYPGVNSERIRSYDLALKAKADVTLFCSTSVFTDEQAECRKAAFVDHGVDYDAFSSASSGEGPEDVREIAHPRIGFVGGIDVHTFDPELFVRVAEAMPDCSFVMVGGCSLPPDWCTLDNVHFLGRKPYEEVASYMAACDVLIMPWNRSPWIKACNPVKLKEYLAAGRPVVSTPFDELARYSDHVEVAEDADGFVQGIRRALESPPDASRLRERVVRETWAAKAESAFSAVEESGISFRSSFRLAAAEAKGNTPMQTKEIPATQQADPAGSSRGYWRTPILIATALLALAGLWVTADAWNDIFRLGTTDEESSHVLLAIPAALWIAWTRRTYTSGARRTGTWLGPALVAFGWLLFAYGDIQLFQSIWHFGAICIVVGCIVTMVGQEVFLRLWPAFAVLLFLIPVPAILRAQIAPPMQTVTAQMTAYLLQTFGEPVTLSGKVLIVNDVSVGIAEACNGIRMVFALALVCFFYAFSTELSARARFMIILASPLIAILVNIVRLVPTVWLYGHAEVEFAEQFHDLMGWAMMPIALFGLIGLRALLSWALKDDPDAPGEYKAPQLTGARPSEG